MATIYEYFSAVWAGIENPLWPHLVLVPLSALAGLAVGAGIFFERPKYSAKVHTVAIWFVLVGVGVEAVCTVSLFVVDERISAAQQSKIIALETEIAPRNLSGAQIADAATKLKIFAGTEYAIGVSTDDPEQLNLAQRIGFILESAKWKAVDWYRDTITYGPGGAKIGTIDAQAGVSISPTRGNSSIPAATALVAALRAEGIPTALTPIAVLSTFPGIKVMIGTRF